MSEHGPRHTHRFDPARWRRLADPSRFGGRPPSEILSESGLRKGQTVVDFGCGIGYFARAAAEIVGPGGRVLALDAAPEMIETARGRVDDPNVVFTVGGSETDVVPKHGVDLIFMANVLHEMHEPVSELQRLRGWLRTGEPSVDRARLVVVDWEKRDTGEGPPVDHRISREEAAQYLAAAGFAADKPRPVCPTHYAIAAFPA